MVGNDFFSSNENSALLANDYALLFYFYPIILKSILSLIQWEYSIFNQLYVEKVGFLTNQDVTTNIFYPIILDNAMGISL